MLQEYYFGLAIIAGAATAAWLFKRERINLTAFISGIAWIILAVTGGSVEARSGCCGATSNAAVPLEIRGVLLALGILSLLALILHQLGVYPPATDQAYFNNSSETNA